MTNNKYDIQNVIFDSYHMWAINEIIINNDDYVNKLYKIMNYLYNNDLVFAFDWMNWEEWIDKIKNFKKYDFKKNDIITNLMLLITIDRSERFIEWSIEYNTANWLVKNILDWVKMYFDKIKDNDYFNSAEIDLAISKAKDWFVKYKNLMDDIYNTNISVDKDFQRKFNHFYKLRQRNSDFYKMYYDFLENNKTNKKIEFKEILEYFKIHLSRFEPSFSSKILSTINPDMPIWDSFVIKNIWFKAPSQTSKNRFNETIYLYEKMRYIYQIILKSEKGRDMINLFDLNIPNSWITDIKKIDFILWQLR